MDKSFFLKINSHSLSAFRQFLAMRGASHRSLKRKESSLHKFFDWAVSEGRLGKNPLEDKTKKRFTLSLSRGYRALPYLTYFNFVILIVFGVALGWGVHQQFFAKPQTPLAYPNAPVSPNRYLSFQGRLTNASDTPIDDATNMRFRLYDAAGTGNPPTGGNVLWDSSPNYPTGACSIDPDQNGIFSTILGSTCGGAIASSVFTENADVWLGVTAGTDSEAYPRIQIATVAYALNAETLQGLPLGSQTNANPLATMGATARTIPGINPAGNLVIAAASPTIWSTSGTFAIRGQALSIITDTGTNGNITLAPDGSGVLNLTLSAGTGNVINATDANLGSSGGKEANTLYYGSVANNNTNYNLLKLESGVTTPTPKFTVDYAGNASAAGFLRANTTGSYFTGDITVSGGGITGTSGSINIGETDPNYIISSTGLAVGGTTSYYLTSTGTLNVATINAFNLAGNMTVNQDVDIIPAGTTGTNDLGSSAYPWDNLYAVNATLSGTLSLGPQTEAYAGVCNATTNEGKMFYNGGQDKYYYCNGSEWTEMGAGATSLWTDQGTYIYPNTTTGGYFRINDDSSIAHSSTVGTSGTAYNLAANSLDTGKVLSLSSTSITSGDVLYLANNTANNAYLIRAQAGASLSNRLTLDSSGSLKIYDTSGTSYLNLSQSGADSNITSSGTLNLGSGGGNVLIGEVGSAVNIHFDESGNIEASAGKFITMTDIGTITPDTTNTYNLGSTALYWNNLYVNNVYSGGSGTFGFWTQQSGALYPTVSSVDLLIGGTSTSSAKFAFTNMLTGTPTATFSGNLVLAGGARTINATDMNPLLLATANTGNVGIGVTNPSSKLQIAGNITPSTDSSYDLGSSSNYWANTYTDNLYLYSTTLYLQRKSLASYQWLAVQGGDESSSQLLFSSSNFLIGGQRSTTVDGLSIQTGPPPVLAGIASGSISDLQFSGGYDFYPSTDSTSELGHSDRYWANTYTDKLYFNSTATLDGATAGVVNITGDASASASLVFRAASPTIDILNGSRLDIQTSVGGDAVLTPRLTLTNAGNVGIGTTNPQAPLHVIGDLYVSDGLSLYENAVSDGTVEAIKFCTGDGETNCVTDFSSVGVNYWTQANGTLYPNISSLDLLIGGTSTSSAKFAFTNVLTGIPTATFSGNLVLASTAGTTRTIGATNMNPLQIGTATTGDIQFYSASNKLTSAGALTLVSTITANTTDTINGLSISSASLTDAVNINMTGYATSSSSLAVGYSSVLAGVGNAAFAGKVGIGTSNPGYALEVATGNAQFDNIVYFANGTTYYVDASGHASFNNITGAGTLDINGAGTHDIAGTLNLSGNTLTSTGDLTITPAGGDVSVAGNLLPSTGSTYNLGSSGAYWNNLYVNNIYSGGTGTLGFWTQQNGALYPTISSVDLLIGGTATSSAKFAFTNMLTGTPTATFSGNLVLAGGARTINATDMNPLLLATANTGNVGIGVTNPSSKLQIAGNITPSTDSSYDLGGSSLYWANAYTDKLYLLSTAYLYSATANEISLSNDVGGSSNLTVKLYSDGASSILQSNVVNLYLWNSVNGGFSIEGTNTSIRADLGTGGAFYPDTDSARNLGTSSYYWLNTYTDKLYLNSTATLDGATAGVVNITGDASASASLVFRAASPTIDILNGSRLDIQTSVGGDAVLTPRLTLTNAGNVGIGTTNPGARLDVVGGNIRGDGDIYTGDLYLGYDDTSATITTNDTENLTIDPFSTGDIYFHGSTYYLDDSSLAYFSGLATTGYTPTAGEIRADVFRDGNSSYYLQPADTGIAGVFAGKVGIGTTNPSQQLDVSGNATVSGYLGYGPNARAYAGTTCNATTEGRQYYDGTDDKMYYCNGSSWVTMGTSSSVSGSGTQHYLAKWSGSSTLTDAILYQDAGNTQLNIAGNLNVSGYATASGSLAVGYSSVLAGVGNAAFAGKVGIGMTNPAYALDVASAAQFDNAVYFQGSTTYYVDASGNAKFLDLIAADTNNPGLTVGNGTTGYALIGASTISDAAGNLTLDSDTSYVAIADDLLITGNDIYDSTPTQRINLGATTILYNTTTTLSGTTLLTAQALATMDTAASVSWDTTSLTLGGSATLYGGSASSGTLTLVSTSDSTKGKIQFFSASNTLDSLGNLTLAGYATASGSLAVGYSSVLAGSGNAAFKGSVGIGTTNPQAPLHVIGDLYVSDGLSLYENAVSDGTVEAIRFCTGDGETNCVTDFSSVGVNYWTQANGTLYPNISSLDLLIGGTSTSSAKFAFTNVLTGTPVATFSGNLVLASTAGTTRTIGATNMNPLQIGTATTGDLQFYSASNKLTSAGALTLVSTITANTTDTINGLSINAASITDAVNLNMTGYATSSSSLAVGYSSVLAGVGNAAFAGKVGIGTTNPGTTLEVKTTNGNGLLLSGPTANNNSLIATADSGGAYYTYVQPGSAVNAPFTFYNVTSGSSNALRVRNTGGNYRYLDIWHDDTSAFLNSLYGGIQFQSGGSTKVTMDNAGSVGIGITPSQKLDVSGNATVSGYLGLGPNARAYAGTTCNATTKGRQYYDGTDNTMYYCNGSSWTSMAGSTSLWTDNTTYISPNTISSGSFRIYDNSGLAIGYASDPGQDSAIIAGAVGIGTTNPEYKLHVESNSAQTGLFRSSYSNSYIGFESGSPTKYGYVGLLGADMWMRSETANIQLDASAVGIGTTAPISKLHVEGTNAGKALVILNETTGANDILVASASGTTVARIGSDGIMYAPRFTDTANSSYFLDPANAASLNLAGYATISGSLAVGYTSLPSGPGNAVFSGNVGIGTTSPDSTLSVRSAGQNAVVNIYGVTAGTDYGVIQVSNTGGLTNPSNRPLILQPNAGNVAIGTTNPSTFRSRVLDVSGSGSVGIIAQSTSSTGLATFSLANTTQQWYINSRNVAISEDSLGFYSSAMSDYALSIKTTGNVGIRTTTPTAELDVSGTASVSALTIRGTSPGYFNQVNGNDLRFRTSVGGDAGLTDRMILTNAGNVGIGTTDPSRLLDVNGIARLRGTGVGLILDNSSNAKGLNWATTDGILQYQTHSSAAGHAFEVYNQSDSSVKVHLDVAGNSYLMGGNVGIGTTGPNANTKVEVAGEVAATLGTYSQFRAINGNYGFMIRNDGTDTYFLLTNSTDQYGSWNSLRPFKINNSSGNVDIGNSALSVAHGGNVTLGSAPSADANAARWVDARSESGYNSAYTSSPTRNSWTDFVSFNLTPDRGGVILGFGSAHVWNTDDGWVWRVVIDGASGGELDVGSGGSTAPNYRKVVSSGTRSVSLQYYIGGSGADEAEGHFTAVFLPSSDGSDLAEYYPTQENIGSLEPGTLLAMDPLNPTSVKRADKSYEKSLLGIVPSEPGVTIGQATEGNRILVALAGRVPTLVSLEGGKIKPGDFLTSSSIPGHGMKFDSYKGGTTVGVAMEEFDPSTGSGQIIPCPTGFENQTCGKIMVFVNRTTYDPQIYLTDAGELSIAKLDVGDGMLDSEVGSANPASQFQLLTSAGEMIKRVGAFGEALIANLKAGLIQTQELIADNIATNNLTISNKLVSPLVETDKLTANQIESGKSKFGEILANDIQSNNITTNNITIENDATISGTLYAEEIITKHGKFGDLIANQVTASTVSAQYITYIQNTTYNIQPSSAEATEGQAEPTPTPTESPELAEGPTPTPTPDLSVPSASDSSLLAEVQNWEITDVSEDLRITSNLKVLGRTSLADTTIAGQLVVDGAVVIDYQGISSPPSSTLYLQSQGYGGIDMLAGKVTIDTEGNMVVQGTLAVKEIIPLPDQDLVLSLKRSNLSGGSTSEENSEEESAFGRLLVKGINDEVVASIDASGSAYFTQMATQKVVVATAEATPSSELTGPTITTNATAGEAILPAYETEITIKSPYVTDNTLIYVTPISSTENKVLYVKAKKAENGWFKVGIDTAIEQEIRFNWWIIN